MSHVANCNFQMAAVLFSMRDVIQFVQYASPCNGTNIVNCQEEPFFDLYIYTTLRNFLDTCIQSTLPITSYPTTAPAASSFEFSAQFQALWSRLYNPPTVESTCTSGDSAVVASCENDASISFVKSTDSSMNCTKLGMNEFACITDPRSIDNVFTSVYFVC
jgi:hypothetical protein